MTNPDLKQFLKKFAATANNVVMLGQFSGDDIIKAAKFMEQCHTIVKLLEDKDGKQENK